LSSSRIGFDASQPIAVPHLGQKMKLIGPAKNLQKNSHLPTGMASASVKNHISVKKSQTVDPGSPKHPHPNSPRKNLTAAYLHPSLPVFTRPPRERGCAARLIPQQLPGDCLALNLRSALVDGQSPHLAVEPLHPVALFEPGAAVDLHCLVDDAAGSLGAE